MVTRFCAPFPNYKKVTRNDQIVMSGKCSKGCFNKHLTHYNFKIYKNQLDLNYQFDQIIWTEFNITDQYITGKPEKLSYMN